MFEEGANLTSCRFLLVEDDDDHAKIIERSLQKVKSGVFARCRDGVEAIEYLRRQGEHRNAIAPDVILLDLKLPKKDGHEVLGEIKNDEDLRAIPVVILTTSDAEADKAKAYAAHANSYIVKPLARDSFRRMIEDLDRYWGAWNKGLRTESGT